MSNLLSIRAKRGLAAGLAGVVGAAALSVVAITPAQAAVPNGSFDWKVSGQFAGHLSTVPHTFTGGASEDADKVVSFPRTGTSTAAGVTTVTYAGSVRGAFAFGGTEYYSVVVAEPTITVNAAGEGTLTAVVSSANAAAQGNAAASIEPTRVTVGDFTSTGSAATGWAGTLPAAFDEDFFRGLTPGVQPHFKSTKADGSDLPAKRPAGFVASGGPFVQATSSTLPNGSAVQVKVSGHNFNQPEGVTDAQYAGVYVGIAESGDMPDTGSAANQSLFVTATPVWKDAIVDGAFTATLNAAVSKLKPGVEYSAYTWQAHTHDSPALDTETKLGVLVKPVVKPPVTPVVKKTPVLTVKWKKKPTAAKQGQVSLTVKKTAAKVATGKATFKITYTKKVTKKVKGKKKVIKKKVTKTFTKTVKNRVLKNGAVAGVVVPKNTKKVVVTYTGDALYNGGSKLLKR